MTTLGLVNREKRNWKYAKNSPKKTYIRSNWNTADWYARVQSSTMPCKKYILRELIVVIEKFCVLRELSFEE